MKEPKLKKENNPHSSTKIKLLNPERKPLTKEKYRELSGRHDLSDEEAELAAQDIQFFAKILYEFVNKNKHI
jgi:hypothetical protein